MVYIFVLERPFIKGMGHVTNVVSSVTILMIKSGVSLIIKPHVTTKFIRPII